MNKNTLFLSETVPELELSSEMIAMNSFGGAMTTVGNAMLYPFKKIYQGTHGLLDNIVENRLKTARELTNPSLGIFNKYKNLPYTDVMDMNVVTVPGLRISMEEFLDKLLRASHEEDKLLDTTIPKMVELLISYVREPELLKTHGLVLNVPYNQQVDKTIGTFKGSIVGGQNIVKFSDLYPTMKAYNESFKKLTQLVGIFKKYDTKGTLDKVSMLVRNVDLFADFINDNDVGISTKSIKELSKITYSVAKEVDLYSFLYMQVRMLAYSFNDVDVK